MTKVSIASHAASEAPRVRSAARKDPMGFPPRSPGPMADNARSIAKTSSGVSSAAVAAPAEEAPVAEAPVAEGATEEEQG